MTSSRTLWPVTPFNYKELGQHWLKWWSVAWRVYLSSQVFLRAISQELLINVIRSMFPEATLLKLLEYLLGNNELIGKIVFVLISYYISFLSSYQTPDGHHYMENALRTTGFITMTSWWAPWRLKSPASRLLTQPFIQAKIKEKIKAPRHWPLWGEFNGERWISRSKGQ